MTEIQNLKHQDIGKRPVTVLVIVICNLFVIWCLLFGILTGVLVYWFFAIKSTKIIKRA